MIDNEIRRIITDAMERPTMIYDLKNFMKLHWLESVCDSETLDEIVVLLKARKIIHLSAGK